MNEDEVRRHINDTVDEFIVNIKRGGGRLTNIDWVFAGNFLKFVLRAEVPDDSGRAPAEAGRDTE